MKIECCIKWTLAGLLLAALSSAIETDDKDDQQIFNSALEELAKSKRPFCNAFTGCGKKRNYYGNSMERSGDLPKITIPIPIYKALIRAASQELRNALERGESIDESYQDYLPLLTSKRPIRGRLQS
ncbi:uncharacterized protein CCAP [Fopius arisanus]|uniref:Uncharacterized protein CCAP n=1 Tax=Fopius arisanus TaxID=64838 RepID=A0A9R1T3F6_9HYME|nr:PREDICTED: uncharacterized protein LOC105265902 [Fopius arisanus]